MLSSGTHLGVSKCDGLLDESACFVFASVVPSLGNEQSSECELDHHQEARGACYPCYVLGFGLCATLGNSDEGTVVPPVVVCYGVRFLVLTRWRTGRGIRTGFEGATLNDFQNAHCLIWDRPCRLSKAARPSVLRNNMISIHMNDMIIIHVRSVSFLFLQMTLLFGFMNIVLVHLY